MPNGSLDTWLHPSVLQTGDHAHGERKSLNLLQRINIAIDVAFALDYLHNHCHTPIIHCDLKPSNILLDGDLAAHNMAWGARCQPRVMCIAMGSFCWKCSHPTNDVFQDGLSLHKLAEMALSKQVMDIVDQVLLFGLEEEESTTSNSRVQGKRELIQRCLVLIFTIGVACSVQSPKQRMYISDAYRGLVTVKGMLVQNRNSTN